MRHDEKIDNTQFVLQKTRLSGCQSSYFSVDQKLRAHQPQAITILQPLICGAPADSNEAEHQLNASPRLSSLWILLLCQSLHLFSLGSLTPDPTEWGGNMPVLPEHRPAKSCSPKKAALIKQTLVLAPCDIPPHYRRVEHAGMSEQSRFLFSKPFDFAAKRP